MHLRSRPGCVGLCSVPPGRLVWLLGATVLRLLVPSSGHALDLQIINFNYESLQVTWSTSDPGTTNLTCLYTFTKEGDFTQCPHYILHGDLTSGCLLEHQVGSSKIFLRLLNGTNIVHDRSFVVDYYLKPAAPGPLLFRWREDSVTVSCDDLPYPDLRYEIQHKTIFDSEWQLQTKDTCNVTLLGMDAEKCYSFRARVQAEIHSYGYDTLPSDWSPVVHQQNRNRAESCPARGPSRAFPKVLLVSILVLLLTLLLMALSVWKLNRMKSSLMPPVPDPKVTFLGLFESHQGNFQAWIQDTQNVSALDSPDGGDPVPEEALVVTLAPEESTTLLASMPAPGPLEAPERTPGQRAAGVQQVQLDGFTFSAHDDSYVAF